MDRRARYLSESSEGFLGHKAGEILMIQRQYTHSAVVFNYFFANGTERDIYNRGNHIFYEGDRLYSYGHHFILAVKCRNNGYILNGDSYSNSTTNHQRLARDVADRHRRETNGKSIHHCIIPFSSLHGAGIKPQDAVILDVSRDTYETINRRNPKTGEIEQYQIHHLGASLIRIGSKRYLSSIDNGASRGGSYYLVLLKSRQVTSIEDAFRNLAGNLSDDEYKRYQAGEILRQGEYFLEPYRIKTKELKKKAKKIPVKIKGVLDVNVKTSQSKQSVNRVIQRERIGMGGCGREQIQVIRRKGVPYYVLLDRAYIGMEIPRSAVVKDGHLVNLEYLVHQYNLSNGVGNAHVARDAIKTADGLFIRGTLRHNQHRMIRMRNIWHRVIQNTAVGSWSATGNVD